MSDTDATLVRQDVVADVDEILEHVINANMLSMPYDVYSELFDAVDGLGVKVEKTEAENTRLREQLDDMDFELDKWQNKALFFKQLADINMSENAKLRELVRDMRKCLSDECKRCHEWGDVCDLDESLRDLGIEVDE